MPGTAHWIDLYQENVNRYGQRPGQAMFNAWHDYRPRVVSDLRGTDVDCYYDDSRIAAFVAAALNDTLTNDLREAFS